jgi:hypothetical protein
MGREFGTSAILLRRGVRMSHPHTYLYRDAWGCLLASCFWLATILILVFSLYCIVLLFHQVLQPKWTFSHLFHSLYLCQAKQRT